MSVVGDQLASKVLAYLKTVDTSLETLSARNEGPLAKLPRWVLVSRRITIAVSLRHGGLYIEAIPDKGLREDTITHVSLASEQDYARVIAPWKASTGLDALGRTPIYMHGDVTITEVGNPLAPGVVEPGLKAFGRLDQAFDLFTEAMAKEGALSMWNQALLDLPKSESTIQAIDDILTKLAGIVARASFKERQIHRYIFAHSRVVLPPHQTCHYEVQLLLGEERRVADLVLEREDGLPPLLIELESPHLRPFKRNGELTAEANHAKAQIAEWQKFIERNAQANASGERAFLGGRIERLIVMGRGMRDHERMLDSRYTDTVVWTYDLLIDQARRQWRRTLQAQRALVGLPPVPLL